MIPAFLLIPALAAGAGGLGGIFHGINNLAEASELAKGAEALNEENLARFQKAQKAQQESMQVLGKTEMEVTSYFKYFTEAFEKIKNRPEIKDMVKSDSIPDFDFNEIKTVSIGAAAFLGAAVGAGAGAVFGAAASAGTTAAVMALGTASTGTAISTLSGAAATNAALAALGGGAIAAGGGGMALGLFVLNAAATGVGLLFGGIAFAGAGSHANKKAHELYEEVLKNEKEIDKSIDLLKQLTLYSKKMRGAILAIHNQLYVPNVVKLCKLVEQETDWNRYTNEQKMLVQNNIMLVAILHQLNNTALYRITETDAEGNVKNIETNFDEVTAVIEKAKHDTEELLNTKEN